MSALFLSTSGFVGQPEVGGNAFSRVGGAIARIWALRPDIGSFTSARFLLLWSRLQSGDQQMLLCQFLA